MNYLEEEIDEFLKNFDIESKKLEATELQPLISSLNEKFFKNKQNSLDPIDLNIKNEEHNPNFWKEIQNRICSDELIFIVFDSTYRAWEVYSSKNIARLLAETTGYPFWVTDKELTFLVHMDDHDCVSWA